MTTMTKERLKERRHLEALDKMYQKREAREGDKVIHNGVTYTIGKIISKDRYVLEVDGECKEFYNIEFKDTDNQYRNWKSYFDGGELILV